MSFLVTARKYRPAAFAEVVAQGHVVGTLLNSIRMGRIAHAYLFTGPRGVGKTTTARIFAKAINCPNAVDGEPCNACDTCVEIAEGRCIDVIEIDGASNNGVEQVRSIRDAVRYLPTREKYKLYIIDEVHMLTGPAFNALLKTLEEPPPHALFVFATTEPHRLPATVISRCQRYDFRRISIEDIVRQLRHICASEGIEAEDAALFAIAKKGDGSMRDSESIFDQVVAFSGTTLSYQSVRDVLHVVDVDTLFRVSELILASDTRGGFELAEDVLMSGYDPVEFLSGLEEHFRNILVARATGDTRLVEAPEDVRARYLELAGRFSDGDLLRLLRLTSDTMQTLRFSTQPRLKFEVALILMIRMDATVSITEVLTSSALPAGSGPVPGIAGGTAPRSGGMQASDGRSDTAAAPDVPAPRLDEAPRQQYPRPPDRKSEPASVAAVRGTVPQAKTDEGPEPSSVGTNRGPVGTAHADTDIQARREAYTAALHAMSELPSAPGIHAAQDIPLENIPYASTERAGAPSRSRAAASADHGVRSDAAGRHPLQEARGHAGADPAATSTDVPRQDIPPDPIVQLLIDGLGAVVLPGPRP